ncbi:uncharacterized protein BXZ73DRAFT_80934 [Epithele typhae]|uniref:uncharacterized protein n=1 Tax=Epithele typhae TaxID=378194 RepID=UPI0020077FB0|nr:uncharacterized protein BXZ73DRAFT_80934 [Epithele typhae]KAH9916966.1 hypothetical protein BXZ73DRAFT_80934 [Epithele typhae]
MDFMFPPALGRRSAAPKVTLASRSHVENMDAGLTAVAGANTVIDQIRSRRSGVTKLILGHNDWETPAISQISLNSNNIGNRGLLAISRYLRDNGALKELFLQNLTDTFVAHFFPLLNAPHIREIHLSVTGLTQASAPHIIEYITSTRCQLHTLKLNGNRLRIRAVRSIIRALKHGNYTLLRLEMAANGLTDIDNSDTPPSEDDGGAKGSVVSWQECENELKRLMARNSTLKHHVEKDALSLLRHARPLLVRPKSRSMKDSLTPCSDSCGGVVLRKRAGGGSVSGCASGRCMGAGNSVLCRREGERTAWLAQVGCTAFELDDGYDDDVLLHPDHEGDTSNALLQ